MSEHPKTQLAPPPAAGVQPPTSLTRLQEQLGVTYVTLWRWRARGWLKVHSIAGRNYVKAEDLAEFVRRMEAGEFAKGPRGSAATRQRKNPNS